MLFAHIVHKEPALETNLTCSLSYADRFLRRKRLDTDCGRGFVLDLAQTTSLEHGDHIELTDGTQIKILARAEALAAITGDNLIALAWHIGNRHTPCQIEAERLLIQQDRVIEHMVEHLGGHVEHVTLPFQPLGGAYGHGRTHSHEHGASTHVHAH